MKVLYFHQHFSLPAGSTGIRSYQMAKKLISLGHDVTMICGSYKGGDTGLEIPFKRGKRKGTVDGINIIEFELSYSNSDGFLKRTITFLKFAMRSILITLTGKYDLIFATSTPLTAGIPGIFARWLKFKPFVFEVRDLWPELPREMGVIKNPFILWSMSILEWVSYHSANHIIGLSPGIVEGIKKRGISENRTSMIPNGCDLSIFSGVQSKWRPNSIAENDFLAIYTGTHGRANGLDAVLNAAKEIPNFPILKEARRETLEDLMDIDKAIEVVEWINSGKVQIKEKQLELPSPFSLKMIMRDYTDVLKLEDKNEFLRRMHNQIMLKLSLDEKRNR